MNETTLPIPPFSEPGLGETTVRQQYNAVTERFDTYISHPAANVLMADEFVHQAVNHPTEHFFADIQLVPPHQVWIILNGRNRQVRYELGRYRQKDHAWEARMVVPGLAEHD